MKISAYIVTLNEEKRLPKTLEALKQVADEIVIVDSGSTDKTEEIAKKYNCKFVFHKWKNISSQKKFAQDLCENDFVLSLDADEVLSPKLIEEINNLKKNSKFQAYKIKIKDMYPGDIKPKMFSKSYNLVRLYDKNIATMPDDLTHDRVVFLKDVEVGQLKNLVYHYSYISLTQSWFKYNMYTDELLKTDIAKGKKYLKIRLITEMPYQFFRYYILKRQFLNGWFGFINAVSLSFFRFLKIAKWVEYDLSKSKEK